MKKYKIIFGALALAAYSTQALGFQLPNKLLNSFSRLTTGHTYIAYVEAERLVREYKCDPSKKETAIIEISEIPDGDGFFGTNQAEIRWDDICRKIVRAQEGGDLEKKAEIPSGGGTIEKGPGGAPEGPSFDGPSGGFGGGQSGSPGGSSGGGYGGGQSGSPGGSP